VLAHQRSGSGPPLVLLHGIGLDRRVWEPVVPILEAEREVIAVDLPGFGESAPPAGAPTIPALADAVQELIGGLSLERPHVAGNSLGGAIALELGARGAARTVCALSPAGLAMGREGLFERGSLRVTHAMARALAPIAGAAYGGPVRRMLLMSQVVARPWRVPAHAAAHMVRSVAHAPGFLATLPEVGSRLPPEPVCPATIAWAEHDRLLLTSRQAPRARRVYPNARHRIVTGCGHVPMWDDPGLVATVLLEASEDGAPPDIAEALGGA
jgi:pimeloyl-ACP methyl ester carboxylesterase